MARRHLNRRQISRIKDQQDRRRQRAAEQSVQRAEEALDGATTASEQSGLVIANFGPTLIVEDNQGQLNRCALRQNLETTVCGDQVVWLATAPGEGVVSAVEPRRSLLTRPDYSGRAKAVAANVDRVAVVFAPLPEFNDYLIDRYLVAIQATGVEALLVLNKVDMLTPAALAMLEERLAVYQRMGYSLVHASTHSSVGMSDLRQRLKDGVSVLVGQSGVGKSSLIKTLLPDREIRIQALSEATGKGTHTTTTSTLYHLPEGGKLIDSPGVRSFELTRLDGDTLARGFVEFAPYLGGCRFSNCRHGVEPGCALQGAVSAGEIHPRRLQSFRQLLEAAEAEEHWDNKGQ